MRPVFVFLAATILASCGGGGSPTGPGPLPTAAATPTPPPGPIALRTAAIRGANGHSASGTARVVKEGGAFALELGDDFRIDSGNNDVYLTRSSSGIASGDLNLGNLKALTGKQSYELSNEGGSYSHVLLWCRPFRVPIGVGELQ